jgi:ubiquinone/menaquinone biosynthesis C-methylase UbiE
MNHPDHVRLLRQGIPTPGGVWADLGSGRGAFTLALADLIGPSGTIYSVDKDSGALSEQARAVDAQFPDFTLNCLTGDFTRPLDLQPLDGIVMANSLHYIPPREKAAVVRRIKNYLKPDGRLIVVEYNVDSGNLWVPHPFTYSGWETIARQAGFANTRLLAIHPSQFLKEFYSAMSWGNQPFIPEAKTAP